MRPVVDQLKLLIRFNPKTNCVELKVGLAVLRKRRHLLTRWTAAASRRARTTFTRSCWASTSMMRWLSFVWTTSTSVRVVCLCEVQRRSR